MLKNGFLDLILRLVVVILIAITFARTVELEPTIDRFFFFASNDPASMEAGKVDELFSEQNQFAISATTTRPSSQSYLKNIADLTSEIRKIEGISDIKSLADGPRDYNTAISSPLWKRFLFGKSKNTSLIFIELDPNVNQERLITKIENIVLNTHKNDFDLQMAGMPFMVEKIRTHLKEDLRVFNGSAVLIFGLLLVLIFGSFKILLGTMIACFTAMMSTFLLMAYANIPVGILTANLSTIVFILTQSHIIFLTSNWKRIGEATSENGSKLVIKAMKRTFNPSFWCMVTTLLGFLSLMMVPAKPLKDLGLGGALGTLAAIAAAYLVYPVFLSWAQVAKKKKRKIHEHPLFDWLISRKLRVFALILVLFVAVVAKGIYKLDLDPGLHEYFSPGSEIRSGIEAVDKNGGSSVLSFVISDKAGQRLDSDISYKRMWLLQNELAKHPAVGTVVALPHLIAETESHKLSFLFSIKKRLEFLEGPDFNYVAKTFISPDHKQGHFILRMYESEVDFDRRDVIQELKSISNKLDFNVDLIGGVYYLQGELANLIKASIIRGLGMLLFLFLIIAFIVSRSIDMSLAMVLGLALIPLAVLGIVGFQEMPLDIFATPAVNVCLGIAVDTMIHLAIAVRLFAGKSKLTWDAWVHARKEQLEPILISTGIVAAGFSIFLLSYFPPTFRFGIQIIVGTVLAGLVALIIFPAFGSITARVKKK